MTRSDAAGYKTFDQITGRLDEIIGLVRDKDTSLERSLDLFDEALTLGSAAVELVDTTQFSPEEEARLAGLSVEGTSSAQTSPDALASSGESGAAEDVVPASDRAASEEGHGA